MLPDSPEAPIEAIAAADPDLILAPYSGITETEYQQLSQLAPTVAYPGEPWATPWREVIEKGLAHQAEVLDLLVDLRRGGRTIVIVLHDLNQAARYSDHLIAMRAGAVVAAGPPAAVLDEALVHDAFGLRRRVVPDPVTGTPMVVPIGRHDQAPKRLAVGP